MAEATRLEQAPRDEAGQVAEPEGRAAEVLEAQFIASVAPWLVPGRLK